MPTQGLLAISVFQTVSFIILLILFFLWQRDYPARFFRFWITGWAALTVYGCLRILFLLEGGALARLAALEFYWLGLSCFVASVCCCGHPAGAGRVAASPFVSRSPLVNCHLPILALSCRGMAVLE